MKVSEFIQAINAIQIPQEIERNITENCIRKTPMKTRNLRRIAMAVAAAVVICLLFIGLPAANPHPQMGGIPAGQNTLLIKAHAQDYGTIELIENQNVFIPSGNCFVSTKKEINGQESEIICGMSAPDFMIEGDNIESITYTAQNGMLFCEFNSYDHDGQGNYIWSSSFAIAPVDEYGDYIRDLHNPTKRELVRILTELHSKGELNAFYNQIYTMERAKTDGLTGTAYEKAYQHFLDKCAEPIDFNQFSLTAVCDYDHTGAQIILITIINPQHPPIKPIEAQTITANSGDTVSWYLANSEYGKEILGKRIEDVDFSSIHDRIHITVNYRDGQIKTCDIVLQYSEEGELSIELVQ